MTADGHIQSSAARTKAPATTLADTTSAPTGPSNLDVTGQTSATPVPLPEPTTAPGQSADPFPRIATPPPAPAAPAGQVTAGDLARQIAGADLAGGGAVTELRLDPAELGSLRMSVATSDTSVTLTITAERPETADLIRRHLGELTVALRDMGYQEVNLSFGPGDQAGTGRPRPESPEMTGGAESPLPEAAPAQPATGRSVRPVPGGTLDLRL